MKRKQFYLSSDDLEIGIIELNQSCIGDRYNFIFLRFGYSCILNSLRHIFNFFLPDLNRFEIDTMNKTIGTILVFCRCKRYEKQKLSIKNDNNKSSTISIINSKDTGFLFATF